MKKLSAVLYVSVALGLAVQSQAQTAPASTSTARTGQGETIVIQGKRMPTAEAPRSATCEALIRNDPHFRALIEATQGAGMLGPSVYLPTRMPRNPDYSAPPLTPVGSPLPKFGRGRFGVGGDRSASEGNPTGHTNADDNMPGASNQIASGGTAEEDTEWTFSDREARAACRAAYSAGGVASLPGDPTGPEARDNAGYGSLSRMGTRTNRGRAEIARNDKSLPRAFALFDQRRFAESLDWFRKAAAKLPDNQGGDEAVLFVGKLYLQGLGDKSDPAVGVRWLKKAATARFNPTVDMPVFDPKQPEMNTAIGEAAVILGNIYRTGFRGVSKDLEESRKWYERAFDVGHIPAAKVLGDIYDQGVGTPRDARKAESYYRKAAKFGLPTAQFALAEMLHAGDAGVKQDRKEALRWYEAAAKADHPGALYALARAYDLGDGVRADQQVAIGFYKGAALKGHSGAIAAMGTYFYEGKVLPKDPATARKWFEQAARSSDPDGTFNLAAMVARGEGGPRDVVQAWALMKRAAALGNETAPTALAALEQRMTAADKAAAAALLRRN